MRRGNKQRSINLKKTIFVYLLRRIHDINAQTFPLLPLPVNGEMYLLACHRRCANRKFSALKFNGLKDAD